MEKSSEEAENKALALLTQVCGILREQDEQRKRTSSSDAPDFDLFKFVRGDELGLSAVLADLLNPHGSHGQGTAFLEAFLAGLHPRPSWTFNLEKCSILLEHSTHTQRRIDMTLTFPQGVIGIENKPWATDQDQQLSHYIEFLSMHRNRRDQNWMLVFLCNRKPNEYSLSTEEQRRYEQSDNFFHVTFQQVVAWLQECARERVCQSDKVRFFLTDLISYVRISINGEFSMSNCSELVKTIASGDNIAAALAIVGSINDAKQQIFEKFVDQLRIIVTAKGYCLKKSAKAWKESGGGFHIFRKESDKLAASFEFENDNFGSFVWGLSDSLSQDESGLLLPESPLYQQADFIMRKYFEGISKVNRQSKGWPWFAKPQEPYLDRHFFNWETATAWLQIKNGDFLEKVMQLTDDVFEAFQGHEEVLAGRVLGE